MRARTFAVLMLVALAAPGCPPGGPAGANFEPDSLPDPFLRPTAALMWPGATRAFQVQPSGDLYNGAWRVRVEAAGDGRPAAAPRRIAYEERWRPVARWTERAGSVRWDFEAVACPAPQPVIESLLLPARSWIGDRLEDLAAASERRALAAEPESTLDRLVVRASRSLEPTAEDRRGLVVSLLARATNTGAAPASARLAVSFLAPDSSAPFLDGDTAGEGPLRFGWAGPARDSALGWCEGEASGNTWRREVRLAPGRSCAARFALAAYPLPARSLAGWAAIPHERRVEFVRAYWNREAARGAAFVLGDEETERAVRAARVVLLACRERRGGHIAPLGGPFQYRNVWLRDGARAIEALAVHGYVGEAREEAASFLAWQWPHGPFVSQGAQLDGTGQALWAFEQAMLRPTAAPDVARYADAAARGWRWCERMRAAGRASGDPRDAMLPAADPHDNELVRGRLVGTDAWALAGYRSAARLLRAAGRDEEAEAVEQSRLHYRSAFARALARTGSADIPPSWENAGLDWGNLAVVHPCGAVPAAHPRADSLARRIWAAAGGAGLGTYGAPPSWHGYVAADLGTQALLAGRPGEADRVLGALLHWRNASGGACELFDRERGDYGTNLPPHATSAAALLQLVRNMLVYDDGDSLQLTLGARERWWRHGGCIRRAPTRWGRVSVAFAASDRWAHWSWTPVAAWTALTLPPGFRLAGPPAAPLRAGGNDRSVLAPPGSGEARVCIALLGSGLGHGQRW